MKLWEKEHNVVSEKIADFTVGSDLKFDYLLAKYDVLGSIAHVEMLVSVGLLGAGEKEILVIELKKILKEIENGKFEFDAGIEDVHSQVELMLTCRLGDLGKKIHSGRSRNDQALVDIKLFLKAEIKTMVEKVEKLFCLLLQLSEIHKNAFLPGYTHFQLAMPSSFGLWFAAYAESLCDDLEVLSSAYRVADQNPLGSGAGYGSSFPLDRKLTTELLEFSTLNFNSIYAQMSRGKTEKVVAMGMACIAATLSKLAYDVCLYMNQQFNFVSFPKELTTGSSIMPHKKNPDVFELIRAKCNRIQAVPNELTLLTCNLPSGYHRDMQLTKECLFPAIMELKSCLEMSYFMLTEIQINKIDPNDPEFRNLYSVDAVNALVMQGVAFRDAYKQVAKSIDDGDFSVSEMLVHTHEGSVGNLCNDEIEKKMKKVVSAFAG